VLPQFHSIPAAVGDVGGETVPSRPAPGLHPLVAGYASFRSPVPGEVPRRLLPLNHTTVIVDFTGAGALVTGPRATGLLDERSSWRHGVSIGLTPAGTEAALGVPASALVEQAVPLESLIGRRADRLTEHLADLPDWPARFAALDRWLTTAPGPERGGRGGRDEAAARAWWHIQHRAGRVVIGAVADELGVSQRHLQVRFLARFGLPPKTVARIARFQRALGTLTRPGATLARAAAACGYCDQAHFHRETRALTGVTPGELFAFVQYREQPAG
jgi:AraC-like DNA-binding protein